MFAYRAIVTERSKGMSYLMNAIRLHPPGGLDGLALDELEVPRPGAGEVLVRVHAAAITRDELDWKADRLPAIPSYEFSGVVASVGPSVDTVTNGQPVYALSWGAPEGAAADYTLVPEEFLAPKPTTLGHVESAAIPLAALSAWQGLFDHGSLTEGERVLIHGAAGGVGHFAVQLAHLRGAYVIGTASSANAERVAQLGADQVVGHPQERFEDLVDPVDLVFDTAGGDRLERSRAVLRPGGRIVSVAAEPPGGGVYFVVEPGREQLSELARLADSGELRPAIDSVFSLADARLAFERVMEPAKRGKVVLRVVDD
jgi:NADPH:quinone reductase-like Zn-dependent oxidoreductase